MSEVALRLTIRLLGTEVLHLSTDPDEQQTIGLDGDSTSYPMGFVARMERPHESETPDRDW